MFHHSPDAINTVPLSRVPLQSRGAEASGLGRCEWVTRAIHRLKDLRRLPLGWDGHCGVPADPDVFAYAGTVIAGFMRPGIPMPAIMPLSDGGIQFEWHRNGWDVEIEISAPHKIRVFARELATEDEKILELKSDLFLLNSIIEKIKIG